MTSKQLNNLFSVVIVILFLSVAWDVFTILQGRKQNIYLGNYIEFENVTIDSEKQVLIDRIKTSIAFKNSERRNKLAYLSGFESLSQEDLEKQILRMHSNITTLDSLPYGNDDIISCRQRMNKAQNQSIKALYKELLTIAMLKSLASDVFADSGEGLSRWMIMRPISKDSSYIGTRFYADGISKHAYQVNGLYFEGSSNSTFFTVPKNDTLNIRTLFIRNQLTYIDTQYNTQRISFNGKEWRDLSN
jgi:hypothetical protein